MCLILEGEMIELGIRNCGGGKFKWLSIFGWLFMVMIEVKDN